MMDSVLSTDRNQTNAPQFFMYVNISNNKDFKCCLKQLCRRNITKDKYFQSLSIVLYSRTAQGLKVTILFCFVLFYLCLIENQVIKLSLKVRCVLSWHDTVFFFSSVMIFFFVSF